MAIPCILRMDERFRSCLETCLMVTKRDLLWAFPTKEDLYSRAAAMPGLLRLGRMPTSPAQTTTRIGVDHQCVMADTELVTSKDPVGTVQRGLTIMNSRGARAAAEPAAGETTSIRVNGTATTTISRADGTRTTTSPVVGEATTARPAGLRGTAQEAAITRAVAGLQAPTTTKAVDETAAATTKEAAGTPPATIRVAAGLTVATWTMKIGARATSLRTTPGIDDVFQFGNSPQHTFEHLSKLPSNFCGTKWTGRRACPLDDARLFNIEGGTSLTPILTLSIRTIGCSVPLLMTQIAIQVGIRAWPIHRVPATVNGAQPTELDLLSRSCRFDLSSLFIFLAFPLAFSL